MSLPVPLWTRTAPSLVMVYQQPCQLALGWCRCVDEVVSQNWQNILRWLGSSSVLWHPLCGCGTCPGQKTKETMWLKKLKPQNVHFIIFGCPICCQNGTLLFINFINISIFFVINKKVDFLNIKWVRLIQVSKSIMLVLSRFPVPI